MQITSYDYVKNSANKACSLAKIANLIEQARREAIEANQLCLLFDNGDTLQGNPMADMLAEKDDFGIHPMVACLNALKYDAVGIGNHDCDFGLPYLNACLSQMKMPVISTNLQCNGLERQQTSVMLERSALTSDGTQERLKIGVLSSLPDKTATWNRHHLSDRATLLPPVPTLKDHAAKLKAEGADIVVVLAHMGIAIFDEGPEAQNQIIDVAALEDIDAVIGGHTHLRFPGADHAGLDNVDAEKGTVHGTPVVQPGVAGSDLGCITLSLAQDPATKKWSVDASHSCLRPIQTNKTGDKKIIDIGKPAHRRVRRYLSRPAAQMASPMNSYFALAAPSPVIALMAEAKYQSIAKAVEGTEHETLPLVAVASATLSGGYDGPDNFVALEGGLIEQRHIAGLNPYANQVWAVRATGARLLDWLERSAVIFNELQADSPDQLLINPQVPGFRFDACYGLTYQIDPRLPPYYDPAGQRQTHPDTNRRVSDVRWQGEPLDPEQEFLVATTDHRAGGGGLFQPFYSQDVIVQGRAPLRAALLDYLKAPDCLAVRNAKPWRLPANMGCSAILHTAPEAAKKLEEIAHFSPETCGFTDDGFLRVRLHL